MIKLGFYFESSTAEGRKLPLPEQDWQPYPPIFVKLLDKVENLIGPTTRYRGWSDCRVCGKHNGSVEFTLNNFTWPEGYKHYIAEHNVHPPPNFVAMILDYLQIKPL